MHFLVYLAPMGFYLIYWTRTLLSYLAMPIILYV